MNNLLTPLNLDYRKDLGILFCRWGDPGNSAQIQQGYRAAVGQGKECQVNTWLFDLRRRGPISAEDQNWILQHFFSTVESAIPGKHYFAYLVTPTHYVYIRDSVGLDSIRNFRPNTEIHLFESEQKAVEWLKSKQG
jgi:hypothetical protein